MSHRVGHNANFGPDRYDRVDNERRPRRPRVLDAAKIGSRATEAIDVEWDVDAEARGFIKLLRVSRGRETPERIERDIRMSPDEFALLVAEYPTEHETFKRIHDRRERTWWRFCELLIGLDKEENDEGNEAN